MLGNGVRVRGRGKRGNAWVRTWRLELRLESQSLLPSLVKICDAVSDYCKLNRGSSAEAYYETYAYFF